MPRAKKPHPSFGLTISQPACLDPRAIGGAIARFPRVARWILFCIYYHTHTRHREKEDRWIRLGAKYFDSIIKNKNAIKPVRDALKAEGFIEVDEGYLVDSHPKGFLLGPRAVGADWIRVDLDGKVMESQYGRFAREATSRDSLTTPAHHHLAAWCDRASFDLDGAKRAIAALPEGPKRTAAEAQVDFLEKGWHRRKVCGYGRFHSNFTSLSGFLRRYLALDGEPLVNIDLCNSQPVFLSNLLLSVASSLSSPLLSNSSAPLAHPLPPPPTVCFSFLYPEEGLSEFARVVGEGRLYESLVDEVNRVEVKKVDRPEVKARMMTFLFGDIEHMDGSSTGRAFGRLYPAAYDLLRTLKLVHGSDWVPQEMQRRESALMVGLVAERLRAEHPAIPILTIHDSFLTPARHAPVVEQILRDAFFDSPTRTTFRVEAA